ncbi:MAG: Na+/melibiose symporter-like transporter [Parvibaculaceae bacterium]|jgi:GPH family glycoside/pentoside/hexuronide:cation symporter|nr:MFS transporter [Parvibaculaceae bacterium]
MSYQRLSNWKLIFFSGPAIPIASLGLPLTVFLPQYYEGSMGLSLATVGTVFLLARLWDVVTDPLMGVLSDRFPTRWGRRRHWIVMSVPLLMLSGYMIYFPSGEITALYLFGWLFVLYVGWTMLTLSHMSWGAELDMDYNERSRIQGFREGFQVAGTPLIMMAAIFAVSPEASKILQAEQSIQAIGAFFLILLPIAVGLAVSQVGEPFKHDLKFVEASQETLWQRIKGGITPLRKNRALLLLVTCDFFSGFSSAALGTLYLYEVEFIWQLGDLKYALLLVYFVAGVLFVPVILKLAKALGKNKAAFYAAVFNVVLTPFILLLPPGVLWIHVIALIVMGVNVGSMAVLYRGMMGDVCDVDELETGERRTGLFFSMLTLSQKVGAAMAVGVMFWILDAVGFSSKGENSETALTGLALLFVIAPVVCNFIVAFFMWRFPIDKARQEEMRAEIDARRADVLSSEVHLVEALETEQRVPEV